MPDIWKLMRAIRRSSLTAPERHTLLTLTTLIDPKTGLIPERFQPSLTDLQRFTGLGRSTIVRSLNVAENTGWLKRTVPTKQAARKNKEKTSYLLVIPPNASVSDDEEPDEASATAGLVPQRDQLGSWSQSGTSATVALELVPQWDQASATVGHKELNHVYLHEPSPPTEEGARDAADDPDALFSVPGQRPPAEDPAPKGKPSPKRKRLSRTITKQPEALSVDWHVSDEMAGWAKVNAPNVIQRIATQRFITHFGDSGKRHKDWDRAWRNWILGDQQRHEERNGGGQSQGSARHDYQGRRSGNQHQPYRDPADISRYKTSKI